MKLVSSRDEFPFLISVHPISYLLSPLSHPLSSLLSPLSPSLLSHPLSSLLSPMWQKLPYICNNFFYYNNLSITFLNYCTIEKSPGQWWTLGPPAPNWYQLMGPQIRRGARDHPPLTPKR